MGEPYRRRPPVRRGLWCTPRRSYPGPHQYAMRESLASSALPGTLHTHRYSAACAPARAWPSPAPKENCAASSPNCPTVSSGNSAACTPPASIPSAISPKSSPSQDQPSIAHSTDPIPLSVRFCPLPESTRGSRHGRRWAHERTPTSHCRADRPAGSGVVQAGRP